MGVERNDICNSDCHNHYFLVWMCLHKEICGKDWTWNHSCFGPNACRSDRQRTTKYRVNSVDSSTSQDGKYELLFQQIGEPDWPFGYTHARLVLKDELGTIAKYSFDVRNDGASVHSDSWQVIWKEDSVEVVISGKEQNDEQYILYFDGKTDSSF